MNTIILRASLAAVVLCFAQTTFGSVLLLDEANQLRANAGQELPTLPSKEIELAEPAGSDQGMTATSPHGSGIDAPAATALSPLLIDGEIFTRVMGEMRSVIQQPTLDGLIKPPRV